MPTTNCEKKAREKARALHRVWRSLNDGACPSCHKFHQATQILRTKNIIACPSCSFSVTMLEIAKIEKLFAPEMNAALNIFLQWRREQSQACEYCDKHLVLREICQCRTRCDTCGYWLTGQKDDSSTRCRWCVTSGEPGPPGVAESK